MCGRRVFARAAVLVAVLVAALAAGPVAAQENAPAAPENLSAAEVSHDSVTLSWDAPGDSSITGYLILRRDIVNQAAGGFDTIAADTGSAATNYTDATAEPETHYAYRIKAHNASGTSPQSNYVNVTTPAAPAAPAAPGAPQNLTATVASATSVTLSWDDPGDSSISGYLILRRDTVNQAAGSFDTIAADTASAAITYTDATAEPETRYAYRIKAHNASGTSPQSNYVNVTTPAQTTDNDPPGDDDSDDQSNTGTIVEIVEVEPPTSDEDPLIAEEQTLECETTTLTPTEVHSTTVTVDFESETISGLPGRINLTGFVDLPGDTDDLGSIGDATFSYQGTDYTIREFFYIFDSTVSPNTRRVDLEIDGARRLPSGFQVEVDGRVFDFGDASFVTNPDNRLRSSYVWTVSASLGWDRGDTLAVTLAALPQPNDSNPDHSVNAVFQPNGAWCEFATDSLNPGYGALWFFVPVEAGRRYSIELQYWDLPLSDVETTVDGWFSEDKYNDYRHPWIKQVDGPRNEQVSPGWHGNHLTNERGHGNMDASYTPTSSGYLSFKIGSQYGWYRPFLTFIRNDDRGEAVYESDGVHQPWRYRIKVRTLS